MADAISQGDLDHPSILSRDEIGDTCQAFEKMRSSQWDTRENTTRNCKELVLYGIIPCERWFLCMPLLQELAKTKVSILYNPIEKRMAEHLHGSIVNWVDWMLS